jgi:hypothetical protein
MGHSNAKCLLVSFKKALAEIPLKLLLQVSMNSSAVSWNFFELLAADEDAGLNNKLIEIGSCGLHVINGAFQTGHKVSGWNANAYLRALYGLFKDSPARWADYSEITGSKVFPKKFCQVRWVENVEVAERALEILANVKKFVDGAKKLPTNVTSTTVRELCADKLASAKIAFFASVAAQCEPLLKRFQTQAPVAPFLFDDIINLLRVLMKSFVKNAVMQVADSASKLVKIDLPNKDNLCSYKEVDIGVGATRALSQSQVSDEDKLGFKVACEKFLSTTVTKI